LGQEGLRAAREADHRRLCAGEGKWDGIYVGPLKDDALIYAGKVDRGFDKTSAADLQKRLKPLIRKTQPYAKRIVHKGIWVEPKLLAEIEYRAWCGPLSSEALWAVEPLRNGGAHFRGRARRHQP
jgi:bifunctional non-homologous end joining protein LigD